MSGENVSIDLGVSLSENSFLGVQKQLFKPIAVWINL